MKDIIRETNKQLCSTCPIRNRWQGTCRIEQGQKIQETRLTNRPHEFVKVTHAICQGVIYQYLKSSN